MHITTSGYVRTRPDMTFPTTATAAEIATAALAKWGITAHEDGDADEGTSWLVLGRGEGRPQQDQEHYLLIVLYVEEECHVRMDVPVQRRDTWRVISGDGTGAERETCIQSAPHIDRIAEYVAGWLTAPFPSD